GDDAEALGLLVDDANERGDHEECADLLRRLGAVTEDPAGRLALALREAKLYAEGLGDVDGAIARYENIVTSLDTRSRAALAAIAELEEKRGNARGAASALERELALAHGDERVAIAGRLAHIYETENEATGAIRALEIIHQADPEDF